MKGDFTLPGEAGYERLTLELAEKWGADMIRDSDGTKLSSGLLNAGYGIYSTVCVIRDHNEWAKNNPDKLQQTFLMAGPIMAVRESVQINLMKEYFKEQFRVNESPESMERWQVFDRTAEKIVPRDHWHYSEETKTVTINACAPWHSYTINFLAYRIWEEISMYNHVTNGWEKEHLMPIDPRYEETQHYLLDWMRKWCAEHPATKVVRFTSMFYNFVWIWGSSEERRNIFTDWGSYDFTVSPYALALFEKKYGYEMTSEDFINQGKLHVTHMPCNERKRDWIEFVNDFVIEFGRQLVEIVHSYGKLAYVFYDDSWVGIEPYNGRFEEFGFDGIIKCVFSGYEVRMCAGVPVKTHEIRLHPYLFPTGLGGAPTFSEGGDPVGDARRYWLHVRRALLWQKIDRIGLGGYLHLTENYPDFCDYIAQAADEFRRIKQLHEHGRPITAKTRAAVLHSWGSMRSWTLSGHFHESDTHDLIHINEALAGMPLDVGFLSFEDIRMGKLMDYQVLINAGRAGDAWSGGNAWKDEKVVSEITRWVYEGGTLIGVNEPSAVSGFTTCFRMASVLGVDLDNGDYVNHGKWSGIKRKEIGDTGDNILLPCKEHIYIYCRNTEVLSEDNGHIKLSLHPFGKGQGIYMSGFRFGAENNRLLLKLILSAGGESLKDLYQDENSCIETAYYPVDNILVLLNNSPDEQRVAAWPGQKEPLLLKPYETKILVG